MSTRKALWTLLLSLSILTLGIIGCSSDKVSNPTTPTTPDTITTYFPLDQGWRISYTTTEPTTANFDVEVTDAVEIYGNDGFTVRQTNLTTFEQTFKYIYATSNAIYESHATNDPGSKILEMPFNIGNSWIMYTEVNNDDDDSITVNDFDDDNVLLSGAAESAYNVMSIVAKESVEALNGTTYPNCLKIEWQTGELSYKYFWYAANIGLVKFEDVPNALSADDGNTVTVMNDFELVAD
ncbi:MAG: hypothetical protein R3F48_09740 [Candidatus Zixiibacteriota bacterium]